MGATNKRFKYLLRYVILWACYRLIAESAYLRIGETKGGLWNGWTRGRLVVRRVGDRRACRFTFYVASDQCFFY